MSRRDRFLLYVFLFTSGACALAYQVVWMRQFRLVFGGTTGAAAAVTAVFLGGLGAGGWFLGRRADASRQPLRLYGLLELAIALVAAATPLLLAALHTLYVRTGGSFALGPGAVILRLLIAVIVVGIPTFLMGGTLPAAARAVESASDARRRGTGLLIAINTAGAVTGAICATFVLLEAAGNRRTLWMAAALNVIVALGAILVARGTTEAKDDRRSDAGEHIEASAAPWFVYAAAFGSGFVFLTLELSWNRLLAPLLGGTTYTFGLTLAVALAGLALGGLLFAIAPPVVPSLRSFAITCALEAAALAIPFALGDRLAIFALLLRPLGATGLDGLAVGWVLVAAVMMLPAAIVAGYQFPLLIALLGKGREDVGMHVGRAYAWNTAGTISGSLLSGFLLLPALHAEGCWQLAASVLAVLALSAAVLDRGSRAARVVAAAVAVAAVATIFVAVGPTALWKHSPIGAGRAVVKPTENGLEEFTRERRRVIAWEAEGVESSVALSVLDGNAFIVNGKSDGHSRYDAGTQVMGGILGALLHPAPRNAAVVGLGTGTTAGWLGVVPGIERVDVIEIEPAIRRVAEECVPVNQNVLANPKVKVHYGDGREFLMTARRQYDLISSEPSNPYRAGVSTLFTSDFYDAVTDRLAPGGLFLQFLQAYEIDSRTLRSIYASMTSVFPSVQTWQTQRGDLLLVASSSPRPLDLGMIQKRMQQSPFREALWNVWRVDDPSGLFAHYVAGTVTARSLGAAATPNTDDRTIAEYGFARTVGNFATFEFEELERAAGVRKDDLPAVTGGTLDPDMIRSRRAIVHAHEGILAPVSPGADPFTRMRNTIARQWAMQRFGDVLRLTRQLGGPPATELELLMFTEALAEIGNDQTTGLLSYLRAKWPVECLVIEARLRYRQGRTPEAVDLLSQAFVRFRTDPWPLPTLMRRSLDLAVVIAGSESQGIAAQRLFTALEQPFVLRLAEERRLSTLGALAERTGAQRCTFLRKVFNAYGENLPWNEGILRTRLECASSRDREKFREELARFVRQRGESLEPEGVSFDMRN